MDPLDQRLTDAGAHWRSAQPRPPDLDRLVAGLDRGRGRPFPFRLALVAAGLIVLGALAVVPGAGGFLRGTDGTIPAMPTAAPSPTAGACGPDTACPSPSTAASSPTAHPDDAAAAVAQVDRYEAALVAGDWQTAFDMLAPSSPTHEAGYAAYADERAAYYESVGERYVIGTPTPVDRGAGPTFAIEVDYPALAGNNAGFDLFEVAQDSDGAWKITPSR